MASNIIHPLDIAQIEREARQMRAEAIRDLFRGAAKSLRRLGAGRRAPALS